MIFCFRSDEFDESLQVLKTMSTTSPAVAYLIFGLKHCGLLMSKCQLRQQEISLDIFKVIYLCLCIFVIE